jgi:hypothetical protein
MRGKAKVAAAIPLKQAIVSRWDTTAVLPTTNHDRLESPPHGRHKRQLSSLPVLPKPQWILEHFQEKWNPIFRPKVRVEKTRANSCFHET